MLPAELSPNCTRDCVWALRKLGALRRCEFISEFLCHDSDVRTNHRVCDLQVGRRLRTLQTETAILGKGISDADVTTLLAGWVQTATLKEGSKVLAAGQRAAHVIYVLTGSLRGIDMADAHVCERSHPRVSLHALRLGRNWHNACANMNPRAAVQCQADRAL
jgi:hypothetical protein